MKTLLFLLSLILLQSCADDKRKAASEGNNELLISETQIVQKLTASTSTEAIVPVYNFDELSALLHQKNDTTYVVNFWATWCKPCIKELPYFEKLTADHSEEKLKVILVSLDFVDKLEKQVIPFLEKNQIQSQVILLDDADANSWIPKVSPDWSGAIPATIIYKNDTRKFYEKSFTLDELQNEVKSIL